jgi:hypothetical protein
VVRLGAVFVLLFVIGCVSLFEDGRATQFNLNAGSATATAEELVPGLGDQDPSHCVGLGYDIAEAKRIPADRPVSFTVVQPRARDVLNLWPPGMHLYYAALFTVFGPDMPVALVVGLVTALIWAALLTAFVDLWSRHLRWFAVVAVLLLLLASDVVQERILGDRVLWSEGLFTWFVLAAVYAAARVATARSDATRLGWAATVGALLGLSAFVRTVAEPLGWLMLVLVAVWGAASLVRTWWHRRRADGEDTRRADGEDTGTDAAGSVGWRKHLLALLLAAVAFQVVTVPWRVYAAQSIRPGDYRWTTATNRYWHHSWMPDSVFRARQQSWLLVGRPNTACKVDRDTCARIARYERRQPTPYSGEGRYSEGDYRQLAIDALTHHPVAFAADRLYYLNRAWFWLPQERAPEYFQNAIALVALVATLWLVVRRIRRVGPDLLALLFPGLLVVSIVPLVFLHFEPRYFATIKVVALVLPAVLLTSDREAATRLRLARPPAQEAGEVHEVPRPVVTPPSPQPAPCR